MRNYKYKNTHSDNGDFSCRINKELNAKLSVYCEALDVNRTSVVNAIMAGEMLEEFDSIRKPETHYECAMPLINLTHMKKSTGYRDVISEDGTFSCHIDKILNHFLTSFCMINGFNKTHYVHEIVDGVIEERMKDIGEQGYDFYIKALKCKLKGE